MLLKLCCEGSHRLVSPCLQAYQLVHRLPKSSFALLQRC